MGEFQALEHSVVLELQRGDATAARALSADLVALGARMREGSEAPFARALEALSRYAGGATAALPDLEQAIGGLREADAKQRLAYTLTRAAFLDLARADANAAHRRAAEALALSELLQRPTEIALARVALAHAAAMLGKADEAERHRREVVAPVSAMLAHEARRAIEALGGSPHRGGHRRTRGAKR